MQREKKSSAGAGLDFHVLFTLAFRAWSVVAGGLTTVLLPLWLSPVQQGFYYTFSSLLALQIFFELGLNQVLIQIVGHEVAHLNLDKTGSFKGDIERISKLAAIRRLIRVWYSVAALLFAVAAAFAGLFFFSSEGNLPAKEWQPLWLLLVGATAVNLMLSPRLAFLEATGRVGHVANLRLQQSVMGYIFMWLLLLVGAQLWVAAVVPCLSAIATSIWLCKEGRSFNLLSAVSPSERFSWRADIFPMQWRIAISWISGFFIFYCFTPFVFMHQGAVAAGKFGMAVTIFTAVSTVGMSWVTAKAPELAMLISKQERHELNQLFKQVFLRSFVFTTVLATTVVAAAFIIKKVGAPLMERIADPPILALLALVCIINCAVFSLATYMRAHKEEPMLPVSIVTGLMTISVVYFGSAESVLKMTFLYACVTGFISLPWTIKLFLPYFNRTSNTK